MEAKLPAELVVLATAHGAIPIESGQVPTFTVPDDIKITRVLATRPGVCNITTEDQINQVVKDMRADGSPPEEIQGAIQTLRSTQGKVIKSILAQLKTEDSNMTALYQQFLRSRIATPTVQVFHAGDTLVAKRLERNKGEGESAAFDYKLNALNMPGTPDLFDLLLLEASGPATQTRSRDSGVSVEFNILVDILKSRGVKHLVFYDLTCSSFLSESPMTEREERMLRKTILQKGWGKMRTRRQPKKTKPRRTRKRTLSKWSH
jgi:hypothetical protein